MRYQLKVVVGLVLLVGLSTGWCGTNKPEPQKPIEIQQLQKAIGQELQQLEKKVE